MSRIRMPKALAGRGGMTLVELVVAMTTGLIIIASTTSLFLMLQRSAERTQHQSLVRNDLHIAAERLVGWVRNAESIAQASTGTRLLIVGGQSVALCGAATCWIEVEDEGLVSGPLGDDDPTRTIAGTVTSMTITFGLDNDEDGTVDTYAASIPGGRAADVLAVNVDLTLFSGSARTEFSAEEDFMVVLRTPVINRLAIAN